MLQAKTYWVFCALAAQPSAATARDWQPVERTAYYSVTGATPFELYESIGVSGPKVGPARAIAQTGWDLKWRRDYQQDGSGCVLKSAKPFLTITYTLPRPSQRLAGPAARRWTSFIDGIMTHEKVHGADIAAMVDEILAATAGLKVDNDPSCRRIRARVLERAKAANEGYKARSRAFDQAEMAKGGNIERLVLALVNGR